ncbi:hypothetical protein LOK74_12265 [Brevibacillus humidisoli]|uniref:hypothetical protein n=1 Tax=Brevibacillus humidisoli TaxID=2895522 RepID=UPI001E4F918B|nr:hypothetical protein [Brevibacillus humidisoli]UFJ38864.1 hypothetical protein LOK74_12265 [Brevibacillus humidisoli]
MDVDRRLKEWKESADSGVLRDLSFTPQMEQNVKHRVADSRKSPSLRRAQRWMVGLAIAACTVFAFVNLPSLSEDRLGAGRETDGWSGQEAAEWQPSPIATGHYQGEAFSYWGEKPVRMIAGHFYEDQAQKTVWLLNQPPSSSVQIHAVSQQGERIDFGSFDLKGPLYDADSHITLDIALPSPDIWKLEASSGEQPVGHLFVEVKPGFSDATISIVEPLITQYLEDENHADFSWIGQPRHASIRLIGIESKKTGYKTVYAWGLVERLVRHDDKWENESGFSAPMTFTIEPAGHGYQVTGHQIPKDGTLYWPSIEQMYPSKYRQKLKELTATPEEHNQMIDDLHARNQAKAEQVE